MSSRSKGAEYDLESVPSVTHNTDEEADDQEAYSAEAVVVLNGDAPAATAADVADELVVKAGRQLKSYVGLYRALTFCGLLPSHYHSNIFTKYLYPAACFIFVCLGSVLWQITLMSYFGRTVFGYICLTIEVTAIVNWIFLKYFIGRGALETIVRSIVRSRNYAVQFHKHVKFLASSGVFMVLTGATISEILVYFTVPIFYDISIQEAYRSHLWQMIVWHIFMPIATILWTASLLLFFAIYFMVGAMLRHELGELQTAMEDHHIDSHLFVDWHRGVNHLLFQMNKSFGVICAFYTITFMIVVLIAIAALVNGQYRDWLTLLLSIFFLVALGAIVCILLIPGAMTTACCEDLYRAACDVVGFCYTHRPDDSASESSTFSAFSKSGSDSASDRLKKKLKDGDAGHVELRVTGVAADDRDELRVRGTVLRESARALERAFHNESYTARVNARLAAKLSFHESNERRRQIDESWSAQNSAAILEYLRGTNMSFKIMGMPVTHGFNAKLAYSFVSLAAIVSSRLSSS